MDSTDIFPQTPFTADLTPIILSEEYLPSRLVCKQFRDIMDKLFPIAEYITDGIIHKHLGAIYLHPVTFKLICEYYTFTDWEYIPFPIVTCVSVDSPYTGNEDELGGGCGNLGIPIDDFNYQIVNSGGITVRDIVECVYRMKGSKYDWWYELYGGIEDLDIDNEHLQFTIRFEYGS